MLKLHYAPNTISVAVAIGLKEAGRDFEPIKVDFAKAEQTQEAYHAVNPKGRVPALETPQGILTETGAILEFAAPALVPGDPFRAARMRELMYYLASTMHVAHAHKMRGSRWANEDSSFADMRAKVPETMAECAQYLEDTLAFVPFATGESLTAADAYLYVVLTWLEGDGVNIADFPKLAVYFAMMTTRDSVQWVKDAGML
ncbi:glutathione S-transferase [Cognatiyoonia koreensis]|uniref:Glutathione S-transferase n=1 Tax=Cognatiyoonia koreensis TaxID=364200 RepID=A0A1I0RV59_9RHOB|nr:glutathione S-transferase family protein [Cognatiyoonia koreensis]SEW45397.1 glutathione S-transferase [Cognatiyoonia koreensis]